MGNLTTSSGSILVATAPFDPVTYYGWGWAVVPSDQDKLAARFSGFNLRTVQLVTCLNVNEVRITSAEKLERLKRSGRIRLGGTAFAGLLKDYKEKKEDSALAQMSAEFGTASIQFFGDVVSHPSAGKRIPCLWRERDGSWHGNFVDLDNFCDASHLAIVLSPLAAAL